MPQPRMPQPPASPATAPVQDCDLIMKGGITSGVVYPQAIARIARDYRLRSIGGSSAGAIAACFAAAAEYRRQSRGGADAQGFDDISALAGDLARNMRQLFQPRPALAPLFDLLMAVVGRKGWRGIAAVFAREIAVAAGILTLLLIAAAAGGSLWAGVSAVLAVAIGLALWVVLRLTRMLTRDLPAANFGLCPGLRQPGFDGPGLTDWMAQHIDAIAGLDRPLTIGDLCDHDISVAAMTTDLSSQRPYQLPLQTRIHYFSLSEWRGLLPPAVLDYLVARGTPLGHGQSGIPNDLYQLAAGRDFPVLLVARMSLSFPGLIEAMPLYRFDDQLRDADGRARLGRCLFSDGGISSNFPIHFFDALLPRRPTFGIALGAWEEARHHDRRIHLPGRAPNSSNLPLRPIRGPAGFAMAILNTAKDWQDTIQSMLPGYAERIVTVRLDDATEGGMNLNMPPEVIARLTGYGAQAGSALCERYSYAAGKVGFDLHRRQRARAMLPKMAAALDGLARAMDSHPAPGAPSGRKIVAEGSRPACAALAEALAAAGIQNGSEGRIPCAERLVSDATIRLVGNADRLPDRRAETQAETRAETRAGMGAKTRAGAQV